MIKRKSAPSQRGGADGIKVKSFSVSFYKEQPLVLPAMSIGWSTVSFTDHAKNA